MSSKKKVLFLVPYALHRAPSQRFRVENLLFLLDEANIPYSVAPFMGARLGSILYKPGKHVEKALGIAFAFLKRLAVVLFGVHGYEYIFIHREAAPLGPPVFEFILAKLWRKKIIYDFDDAVWIPNTSAQNSIAARFKCFWKIKYLCRWSYKVSAGNDFLADFARTSGAKNVVFVPTVVNTETRYNRLKHHHAGKVVVGWTGSHSTLKFLALILPTLRALYAQTPFTFLVIADKKPEIDFPEFVFCPWNEQTEIEDLLKIDIGIMPLEHDAWSEGKCGFKLIQYFALGIPAVADSVGVNSLIIEEGKSGFLANSKSDWEHALSTLLADAALRKSAGAAGRQKVESTYSINAIRTRFIGLFQ